LAELSCAHEGLTIAVLLDQVEHVLNFSRGGWVVVLPEKPETAHPVFIHKRSERRVT